MTGGPAAGDLGAGDLGAGGLGAGDLGAGGLGAGDLGAGGLGAGDLGAGDLGAGELRALVREVLREALAPPPSPGSAVISASYSAQTHHDDPIDHAPAQEGPAFAARDGVRDVETVSVRTDAELAAFVIRLLHLFENPRHRADLRAGRLRFRLAPGGVAGSGRPAHRVEKGAVTEAAVRAAAQAGARLVLGRRAVLTPLARDRARVAGVEIEKEH
jgi:hypothetical protein